MLNHTSLIRLSCRLLEKTGVARPFRRSRLGPDRQVGLSASHYRSSEAVVCRRLRIQTPSVLASVEARNSTPCSSRSRCTIRRDLLVLSSKSFSIFVNVGREIPARSANSERLQPSSARPARICAGEAVIVILLKDQVFHFPSNLLSKIYKKRNKFYKM